VVEIRLRDVLAVDDGSVTAGQGGPAAPTAAGGTKKKRRI
jgi:hypothetical protein